MTSGGLGDLHHVGIVVKNVDDAAAYFTDVLGLAIVGDEIAEDPGARLLYLDAGNVLVQLLEPVRDDAPIALWLREHGEGLHHVCFTAEDLRECEATLNDVSVSGIFRAGLGASAFFLKSEPSNVKIEVTGPVGE